MHIKSVSFTNFKRFTETTIEGIPATVKLVILTGPNGSGKSAVLEGFNQWQKMLGQVGQQRDEWYFPKNRDSEHGLRYAVEGTFHEELRGDSSLRKRVFYIRSAYRHDPEFNAEAFQRRRSIDEENTQRAKLIDTETRVRENYTRLVALSVRGLYSTEYDGLSVPELRERIIGDLRQKMVQIFGDLILDNPGDPLDDGTFFFTKGTASGFNYKNLSAGEKAAFDLLLDFLVRLEYFTDSVFCIDEPELHMGSATQAKLLRVLTESVPDTGQLWIATHSLGMLREALRQHNERPNEVAFIDMTGIDFDEPQTLTPRTPDREFWRQVLAFTLDDLASLLAPARVFICEGASGFDADVFRVVFGDAYPDCEFVSVGGSSEVIEGSDGTVRAIQIVAPGTRVIRVVDRDDRSNEEVEALGQRGIRVLSRRNLESYLLDDELLEKLCREVGKQERLHELLAVRDRAVSESNGPPDDLKPARGAVQVYARNQLQITQGGSNAVEFARSTLSKLLTAETDAYRELQGDLFA